MGFPLSFSLFIIELNEISFQILLQDKDNINVQTVNIEFMWLGMKLLERLSKSSSFSRF